MYITPTRGIERGASCHIDIYSSIHALLTHACAPSPPLLVVLHTLRHRTQAHGAGQQAGLGWDSTYSPNVNGPPLGFGGEGEAGAGAGGACTLMIIMVGGGGGLSTNAQKTRQTPVSSATKASSGVEVSSMVPKYESQLLLLLLPPLLVLILRAGNQARPHELEHTLWYARTTQMLAWWGHYC